MRVAFVLIAVELLQSKAKDKCTENSRQIETITILDFKKNLNIHIRPT